MSVTPDQVRAARRMLGWSRDRLAGLVGVSATAINNFEVRGFRTQKLDLREVRATLEAEGVEFMIENTEEHGVRMRKHRI